MEKSCKKLKSGQKMKIDKKSAPCVRFLYKQ